MNKKYLCRKEKRGMEKDNILQESKLEKKSKNRIVVIVIGILALIAIVICIGISIYNKLGNRLERVLNLGQKYLLEEDYEQAIVEFDKVIEIDPMNVEAYFGKAEAYIGLEDFDSAVKVLEEGYELTESNEILQKLEELQRENEKAKIEELVEYKEKSENEYKIPYYELGFSPEDFTVAGYSVMDGNHVDDVLRAAAEIMPHYDDVVFDYEYDGWSYSTGELSSVRLGYHTPRFGKWYFSSSVSYSPYGDGIMIFVSKNLDADIQVNDPANEFPLYGGPIVVNVTSYEESLDILGVRQLVQAVEATEADENSLKSLEFESQYGIMGCSKVEEMQGSISISLNN